MGELVHFEPTRSDHVRRLSYDPDSRDLHITFANDSQYTHAAVPPEIFAAMTRHASVGEYYHRVIKKHYPLTGNSGRGRT